MKVPVQLLGTNNIFIRINSFYVKVWVGIVEILAVDVP